MNNYTGNSAGIVRTDPTVISQPQDDIDFVAASTQNTADSKIADLIQFIREKGAFGDGLVNALPFIFNGAAGDTHPAFTTTAAVTDYKLLWYFNTGSSRKVRLYLDGTSLIITVNAAWGGLNWAWDTTDSAVRYRFQYNGLFIDREGDAHLAGATFSDGAWVVAMGIGNGVVSWLAGITAVLGDITANAGNFIASAANGEFRGHRISPTGSAPGVVTDATGAGAGPPAATVSGNDMLCRVSFTAGAGALAGDPIFVLTYATPFVGSVPSIVLIPDTGDTWALHAALTGDATDEPQVTSVSLNGFTLLAAAAGGTLVSGKKYAWKILSL